MKYSNRLYQIALTQLFGFGPKKTKQLLHAVTSITEIFETSLTELSVLTGFSVEILTKMNRTAALCIAEDILNQLVKNNIGIIFYTDEQYPRRLKQCEDSPLVLYTKGSLELNDAKFVAVVGTRDASEYGKRICNELISQFKGENLVVVSGMAYGIDIYVHQLCIQNEVPTIGVMAHGLDIVYPSLHRGVAKKMLNDGGLISEYPPGTNPDKEHFPMRNRIVAGLCDATIVVESKAKGGSLITASLANDYNRDVFAFPGNVFEPNSEGCNNLIAENQAHLITCGKDFIDKMGWNLSVKHAVQKPLFPSLTDEELSIVTRLQKKGIMNIDVLSTELKIPSSKLSVLLFQLEMNGVVATVPGNRCQLV